MTIPQMVAAVAGGLVFAASVVTFFQHKTRRFKALFWAAIGAAMVYAGFRPTFIEVLGPDSIELRIRLIVALLSFIVLTVTLEMIRVSRMQERYGFLWLATGLLLLVFKVAHLVWKEKRPCGFVATGTCLALSLGGFMLSFSINRDSLDYFTDQPPFVGLALLMLGITLLTVLTIGLLQCKRKVFLGGYAVVALLSGAAVHPLSMGAAPLMHKQLGEMIQDVVREHGEGRWLCHSSTVAQFVLAQGLPCVNGVQQTANAGLWRRVDPDEVYKDIWNRYAHVSIKIGNVRKCVMARWLGGYGKRCGRSW